MLEWLTELKNILLSFTNFIMESYDKGNWREGQGVWGETWRFHTLSRHITLPTLPHVHPLGNFSNPIIWDFMEVSSCRHNWSLAPFLVFLPSQENRGQGWKCQAYNHGLIFPVAFLIQKPTRVSSLEQNTFLLPREWQWLQKPCVRNWDQRPILYIVYISHYFTTSTLC